MKRRAENLCPSGIPAPQCKRSRRTNEPLPSHSHSSAPFIFAGKPSILTARLQVKPDPEHLCVKRIHALFHLQPLLVGTSSPPKKPTKPLEIGHLYGQTIDRSATNHYSPDEQQPPLFLSEILNPRSASSRGDRPMLHSTSKEVDETELVMRHIFHRDGTPREEFSSRKSLHGKEERVHFIAEFELLPIYRGCGLAKVAMQTYLKGIRQLKGCHRFRRGTVMLSPAALPQQQEEEGRNSTVGSPPRSSRRAVKSLVDIEYALIASYERAGFEVWSKGDDGLGGKAITVMGLRLRGPKIARVSNDGWTFSCGVGDWWVGGEG